MAIKLKHGLKVRIRPDLEVGKVYGGTDGKVFIERMSKYKGKIAMVDIDGTYICLLDIDDHDDIWHVDMFALPDYTDDELFIMYINKQITHEEYEEYMKRGV